MYSSSSGVSFASPIVLITRSEFANAPGLIVDQNIGNRINKKFLLVGDTIYIKTLDQKATVLSIDKDGNELSVQAGALKMTVKTSDCRFVSHAAEEPATEEAAPAEEPAAEEAAPSEEAAEAPAEEAAEDPTEE